MLDETDESFLDSADLAQLVERSDPLVEVGLVLAGALLLGIDLLGAHRGNLRLHLALELVAALLTLSAAVRAWLRRVNLVKQTRKNEPSPTSAGDVEAHIDGRLWSAIETALLEEAYPPLGVTPPRLPPVPPMGSPSSPQPFLVLLDQRGPAPLGFRLVHSPGSLARGGVPDPGPDAEHHQPGGRAGLGDREVLDDRDERAAVEEHPLRGEGGGQRLGV